ncbi:LysR family transcriptional regulator [Rhizobiaceae bacterium n13]|uniref:LysR family transcriptional regulator n=1 Tax=Ferirhizobium litorale TaxID=2927786 RepID=A0AAE3U026_9HYPH|nr:LysR family transcriptional regulator [Fererhizobium litorale]MDI7861478.1 LysR family transcriptional regulator [Fererhizobium litorale]MDI7921624.1 LysR family transcriptional regulator [Fererhizobium litorale]
MGENPNVTLRIDFENGTRLGPGKAELLARIAEHGSIRAAGAAMDMSYRRAWLLADEINRMFREPSIFTRHGGKSGGGAGLTAFGTELLALFQRMEAQARSINAADIARLRDATNPAFKSDAG